MLSYFTIIQTSNELVERLAAAAAAVEYSQSSRWSPPPPQLQLALPLPSTSSPFKGEEQYHSCAQRNNVFYKPFRKSTTTATQTMPFFYQSQSQGELASRRDAREGSWQTKSRWWRVFLHCFSLNLVGKPWIIIVFTILIKPTPEQQNLLSQTTCFQWQEK